MTEFSFENEMIYGRKHLNKINFDKKKYNFVDLISNLFESDLNKLHHTSDEKYELFSKDMLGKDSDTIYHKKFYNELNSGWTELINTYNSFIEDIILPYLNLDEALVQTYPTFRVHLPNNVAIVVKHYDSDEKHNHPKGEINFILALTDMYDSNTVWIEKNSRFNNFVPIELKENECISFNGNTCSHYNNINETGVTRVSFDFRVLPLNYYDINYSLSSVTTNKKYTEDDYYKRFYKNPNININNSLDIWDREKNKFSSTMLKYGVNDAWGVVDLFEKKIAEYTGSKYAVSVDCCTNALFLCLKYLKATGTITIPSRTWISVPCSIKHSGCDVEFENVEWSGMYQLKPYPVWDGAVRMKKNMYQPETYHCLSFHIRKHIPIGRGGMILTDNKDAYDWFRTVRYCGRTMSDDGINYLMYKDDPISDIGWNMYMTPEQAARGLELFEKILDNNPDQESSGTCKDLSKLPFYNENYYYTYDYWFNKDIHQCWHNGDDNYYVNHFYQEIIFKLDIPSNGYIVVLGTHNCVAFEKLCNFYGKERVIGYDLHNPNNHPNVIIKDCNNLQDKMDIAFLHNDLGSFSTTPKLKLHGYNWSIQNMVKGGYILGNNNLNRAKVDIEGIMNENNFSNQYLKDLDSSKFNLEKLGKKEIHNEREFCALDGYMISQKQ